MLIQEKKGEKLAKKKAKNENYYKNMYNYILLHLSKLNIIYNEI